MELHRLAFTDKDDSVSLASLFVKTTPLTIIWAAIVTNDG